MFMLLFVEKSLFVFLEQLSTSPEENTEVEAFNSSLASLITSGLVLVLVLNFFIHKNQNCH